MNGNLGLSHEWRRFLAPVILGCATVAGCGGGGSHLARDGVRTYQYFGSVQCSGGGISLSDMQRRLTEAGIQVRRANCGVDGNMYAAVCGGPDGRIGIIEVPAQQVQAASALGFAPLTNLPAAAEVPCP